MTGTTTKRVGSGITESTTKRVTAAVTQSVMQRVAAAITLNKIKRVIAGAITGTEWSYWKDTWGDKDATKESGSLSFGGSWGRSWSTLNFGASSTVLSENSTKLAADPSTSTTQKRVTETPET